MLRAAIFYICEREKYKNAMRLNLVCYGKITVLSINFSHFQLGREN